MDYLMKCSKFHAFFFNTLVPLTTESLRSKKSTKKHEQAKKYCYTHSNNKATQSHYYRPTMSLCD